MGAASSQDRDRTHLLGDMSMETCAVRTGPGPKQHSQCCLLLLQMLSHFSHRSGKGVSGVRLWTSQINKKVIIRSCLKLVS